MKANYKILIILSIIPFLLGFLTSRYGPWWGLREQATTPGTPTNGVKIYADSNNNIHSLHETGNTSKLNMINSSGQLEIDEYAIHTGDNNTSLRYRDDRFTWYAGGRTMLDAIETSQDILYLGHSGSDDIDISMGPSAAFFLDGSNSNITIKGTLQTSTSKWYSCKYLSAISLSPGASGATLTVPSANTLGGYQLDADTEYIYPSSRVCSDWDGASDLTVIVFFEVNVDNSGGNVADTVDLSLLSYYKGDAETSNKTQTVEVATTVGQSAQYKQFSSSHVIDYDLVSHVVEANDLFAFRLNLETDTSEIDNIIVNFIVFRYQTKKVHIEI